MAIRDTLLLDLGYQPLRVVSWRRALCMHFVGKVELVSTHDWDVHTISSRFPAPAVVRLLRNVRARPLYVRFSRENVYLRDGYQCQYCGKLCNSDELTLDHVVPRAEGGKTTWKNVVTACVECNRTKGRDTPEDAGLQLRCTPTRPKWLAPRVFQVGNEQLPDVWRDWIH